MTEVEGPNILTSARWDTSAYRGRTEAIVRDEARLQAIFNALREPVLTVAADGRVNGFNAAAEALLGDARRFYGRPIREVLPFVGEGPSQEKGPARWQGRMVDSSGRSVDLEVSRALLDDDRLPIREVYVVHDISHHAELNRMREQLLYNVAHELRGPLAVLENALEILSSEYGELSVEEFDQVVRSAQRTCTRLRNLMEDLLSAGNIQSGRFVIHPRPVHLDEVVQDALDTVAASIEARGQRLERAFQGKGPVVLADRRYLRQVLSNLLANASKYSPAGEIITVRAEERGGEVLIAVEDRGPGIPPEQRSGLFERFYRVRPGNEEPGIGLGLAIVKGIVEAHGGSVGVDSEMGAGTRVWFTLRSAEPKAETEGGAAPL